MIKERSMPEDFNTNELQENICVAILLQLSPLWRGATNDLELKRDKVSDLLQPGQALPWWNGLKNQPDRNVKIILHKQGSYREPSKPKPKVCPHP